MYYGGAGVEKDNIEAFKWFLLAARQGDPLASLPLKKLSDSMSPTMIEEAKRRADDFRAGGSLKAGDTQAQHDEFEKLKAKAEQGDTIAQSNLGVAYAEGKGVGKDDTEAARWYRKAAEQGFAGAQFNLARAYADGRGVSKDDVEAAKWCRKSADQGFAYAQIMLSAMYNSGTGVPQSDHEAATLLLKAAEQGVPIAQHYIGLMYGAGKGVTEDYIEAYKWLSLAAARGVEESLRFIEALSQNMAPAMLEEAKKRAANWQPSGGL
jgi:hypothetical protein